MLFCHDALVHRSALLRITSTDNYTKNRKSIRTSVGLDFDFSYNFVSSDKMSHTDENTPLLDSEQAPNRRLSRLIQRDDEASSMVKSHVSVEEQAMANSTIGERLAYNDYTTIDWLHDLVSQISPFYTCLLPDTDRSKQVKDSYRLRTIHDKKSIRGKAIAAFDSSSGWVAAAAIGALTACVAYIVDICAATVSDWKLGHCTSNPFLTREACCSSQTSVSEPPITECELFKPWGSSYMASFGIYVAFALSFGITSASLTMLTKGELPSAGSPDAKDEDGVEKTAPAGKIMYMAAGSGIPEIKTILGGFVIPDFLSLKVLLVKAAGAVFAVSTGKSLLLDLWG